MSLILRDNNYCRLFLSLVMYCDVVIGSTVTPEMKGRISREIVKFMRTGANDDRSYVAGVIGSAEDQHLVVKENTDVCFTLNNSKIPKSIKLQADIQIASFYGLTYIVLKHGSQMIRRIIVA